MTQPDVRSEMGITQSLCQIELGACARSGARSSAQTRPVPRYPSLSRDTSAAARRPPRAAVREESFDAGAIRRRRSRERRRRSPPSSTSTQSAPIGPCSRIPIPSPRNVKTNGTRNAGSVYFHVTIIVRNGLPPVSAAAASGESAVGGLTSESTA